MQIFQERYPNALVLFATDRDNQLRFPTADVALSPKPGWKVTALHPPSPESTDVVYAPEE